MNYRAFSQFWRWEYRRRGEDPATASESQYGFFGLYLSSTELLDDLSKDIIRFPSPYIGVSFEECRPLHPEMMESKLPWGAKQWVDLFYTILRKFNIISDSMQRLFVIDFSKDINVVLRELEYFYWELVESERFNSKGISNKEVQKIGFEKLWEIEELQEKTKSSMMKTPTENGHKTRAIGLWLWDYIKENKCNQQQAIVSLESTGYLPKLHLSPGDEDLRFYLRRTTACIDAGEILPFTKKGTQKQK
jgi:hypothetical protein